MANAGPISDVEALRRLRLMAPQVRGEVKFALQTEAVLEVGNSLVPDHPLPGALSYEVLRNGLALNLALILARLFERGGRDPDNTDRSSIPLMVRLLTRPSCRAILATEAANWPNQATLGPAACEYAINRASRHCGQLDGHPYKQALARLKDFRDLALAHAMYELKPTSNPFYDDLRVLTDIALEIANDASLAVDGIGGSLKDDEATYRRDAERFWRHALRADE